MKEKLKVIKIIHAAFAIGMLLAYFVLGDLINFEKLKYPEINTSSMLYLLIPIVAFLASNFLFKNLISKIDSKLDLEEKIVHYQTASIIRWAIIEGAAFVILILKPDLLIFGILLIIYFILIRPTESRIKNDLNYLSVS